MEWIPEHIASLILAFHNHTLNTQQRKELDDWILASDENMQLFDELGEPETIKAYMAQMDSYDEQGVWNKITGGQAFPAPVVPLYRRPWFRLIAAAAVVAFMVMGYWFWTQQKTDTIENRPALVAKKDIVAPQSVKAVITLADGSKVYLDSAGNGLIAEENNVKVTRNENGEVMYSGAVPASQSALTYNTLSNPRGSKVINLVLADGTKVWLNAESSLKYPVAFAGSERKVEITGEAYFEVAHNASMPFIVSKGETSVRVLGTHFNVNAYDDEDALRVTLLQGSVRVIAANGAVNLKPGEQAAFIPGPSKITVDHAPDLDKIMAWKDGWFEFTNTDLGAIMRQISRWYDLDISWQTKPSEEKFAGRISRDLPLSNVLTLLENSGVHFKRDGNKLIVQP